MDNKGKGLVNIGVGICLLLLGLERIISPSFGRPTGKWALIFGPLFDAFGPVGPALAFIALGLMFVMFGLAIGSKK